MNSTPPRLEINRLNSLRRNTIALENLFHLLSCINKMIPGGEEIADGLLWTPLSMGHMRPAVPPRSSEAFARCYRRQCGQEQMTATADKQMHSTQSVSRAWLLSTAVARETDVSLMEQASAKTFSYLVSTDPTAISMETAAASQRQRGCIYLLMSGVATSLHTSGDHGAHGTRIPLLTMQQGSSGSREDINV